jgi:hypothetical protein
MTIEYFKDIRFINKAQQKYLMKDEVILKKKQLEKLTKKDLIYNILINDYLNEIKIKKNTKKEIKPIQKKYDYFRSSLNKIQNDNNIINKTINEKNKFFDENKYNYLV